MDLIMPEVSRHGSAMARRCYGNFQSPMGHWKEPLKTHAISPHQVYNNTPGKNNSDSAMIIDAMDLLYSGRYDVFCLVTSDSDFTSLAIRLREDGKTVVGIGKQQTSKSFVSACHTFVEIETLEMAASATVFEPLVALGQSTTTKSLASPPLGILGSSWTSAQKEQLNFLYQIISEVADADGWALVGTVGGLIRQRDPAFDARKLGVASAKLGNLLSSLDMYETRYSDVDGITMSVRLMPAK